MFFVNRKIIRRIAATLSAAVIGAGAVCMFAACTSDHPEVTITYSFNGQDYAVGYVLSREDAPETVQHFIELADAGFYDGTVIHSYDSVMMYGGGYVIEDGVLKEKDYFDFVKKYEEEHEGFAFTQSVFKTDKTTPLYTVVGEFPKAGRGPQSSKYYHSKGALVMYYHNYDESNKFTYDVYVERADGGDANEGEKGDVKRYLYNSATSLFYTFLGDSNYERDQNYAVFGKTADYTGEMAPLISAISEYSSTLAEGKSFALEYDDLRAVLGRRLYLFRLVQGNDPDFEALRYNYVEATDFKTPLDMPITVTSVKVNKY